MGKEVELKELEVEKIGWGYQYYDSSIDSTDEESMDEKLVLQ